MRCVPMPGAVNKKILLFLAIGFVLLLLILPTQSENSLVEMTVRGESMEPTLQNGQLVKVDMEYYKNHSVQRDDIIAFKLKTVANPYVKRIIGIPGDKIEIDGQEKVVPVKSYYVLSDNWAKKADSRQFGFLPEDYIIGKVIYYD